jgi:hypothetical protein
MPETQETPVLTMPFFEPGPEPALYTPREFIFLHHWFIDEPSDSESDQ